MDWRIKINAVRHPSATRMSRSGEIVPVVVKKAKEAAGGGPRRQYEEADNPLRGVWEPDPDSWLEKIRDRWAERTS
jgi:hypothetical protein